MTFTFQIFGQNVSVPFGSNIKLPSNKEITVSTNKSSGKESFTVKGEKVISEYEMVIKRGSTSSDSLIEDSNTYITFKVTVTDGSVTPTATPTPTYIPGGGGTPAVINTPTPKPVDGSTSPVPSPSGTPSASVDPVRAAILRPMWNCKVAAVIITWLPSPAGKKKYQRWRTRMRLP